MRRVVVTGLGMVCPIGNDVQTSWENALAGKNGIDKITRFDASSFGCQIAGEVKDFDIAQYMSPKEARRYDRHLHYGVAAGVQAIRDAGFDFDKEDLTRFGCAVGSGIGGLPMICENDQVLLERGPRRVSPFMIPGVIINMISGQLSIMFGFKGPNIAHVTACSTGLHAMGEASWMIRRGDADVMVAGGADASICPVGVAGFDNIETGRYLHPALTTVDQPREAIAELLAEELLASMNDSARHRLVTVPCRLIIREST